MRFIVKNTTKCGLVDLVCPLSCEGCGRIGEGLCECCKKDFLLEHRNYCPSCKKMIQERCENCAMPFLATYMLGWKNSVVGRMVGEYKYQARRRYGEILAEMLDAVIPYFDGEVVVVPMPTLRKHIRERGFDHTMRLAKGLAKLRGWEVQPIIQRRRETVQVGANMERRKVQAGVAYYLRGEVREDVTYLVLDDVWTTGASMKAVGRILNKNGAKKIVAAVLAVNLRARKFD